MLLSTFITVAGLLVGAAPSPAQKAPAAPATKAPAAAAAKAPAAKAGAPSKGAPAQACAAPEPGRATEISDAEWKEYIRKKLAEDEEEKPEPVDPDPFAFSVYRGQRPEPMGTQTIINGGKMDIATLIVPDPPDVVAQTYYAVFERMGFRPLVGEVPHSPGVRYLSFRPTGSKKLKTVTLVPGAEGTVILASVGNPEELLAKKPELPGGLPVPPKAEAASSIQQTEPGNSAQSSYFLVRDSTPELVREFYRRELARRGFAPVAGSTQQDTESFEMGEVTVTLSAKPHTDPNNRRREPGLARVEENPVNALRLTALSVLLAAGCALAAPNSGKKPPKPEVPKPLLTEADKPKTCADQCKVMEKVMVEPCKKGAGSNKQAQQMCVKQSKQVVDACNGSCTEKGRLDKQYILEHIKPPSGYKGGQDIGQQSAKGGSDDGAN